ncbi:diguanylate cyclase [Deinococcus maricopensis DSM 21211]|uniref:Diguanylate cyclase n=2 Tax=Deinococcus TaxID=1298 RepID=E8U8Y6_DEIML|nr:diguanylate cyclase [Deinococcus maricopensis DSM 21211]
MHRQAAALHTQDMHAACALNTEALALAEQHGTPTQIADALLATASSLLLLGEYAAARQHTDRANALLGPHSSAAQRARVLLVHGKIESAQGRYPSSSDALQRALALTETSGQTEHLGDILNNLAVNEHHLGQRDAALQFYLRALDQYEAQGDETGAVKVLVNIGGLEEELEQYDTALRHLRAAYQRARRAGNARSAALAVGNIACVHQSQGQHRQAIRYFHLAIRLQEHLNYRKGVLELHAFLGASHAALGNFDTAHACFELARRLADDLGDRRMRIEIHLRESRSLLDAGHLDDALGTLNRALQDATDAHYIVQTHAAHTLLCDLHEARHDHRAALQHLKAARALDRHLNTEAQERRLQGLLIEHDVKHTREIAEVQQQLNAELKRKNDALEAAYREQEALLQQLRWQAEELAHQARSDALTGLPNRRCFLERFEQERARADRTGAPIAVALIDIDYFKRVNDEHSHAIGDAVLCRIAELLTQGVRASDTAARYGGEEFALLMPDTDTYGARLTCERLRVAIAAHDWSTVHPNLQVTLSIGLHVAHGPEGAERMLASADARLYRAKALGRNRVQG